MGRLGFRGMWGRPRGMCWFWGGGMPVDTAPLLTALSPSALLVYRAFRNEARRSTKALHALLHGLALLIALFGGCCGWGQRMGPPPQC